MSGKKTEPKEVEAAAAGVVVSQPAARRLSANRKLIAIAVVALLLCVGVATALLLANSNPINTTTTSTCPATLLKQAKPLLTTETNPIQLSKLVATIKKVKGYDRDASCLYIVTTYYISISDAQNASTYYAKLAQVYRANVGYDSNLKGATMPLSTLKAQVNFLQQQDPAKHNLYQGPVVK